jgi:geranylgeranyl diphosphate synthase, type I
MQRNDPTAELRLFEQKLVAYKTAIDAEIAAYTTAQSKNTAQFYGEYSKLEVDTFLDILSRDSKRIRGALVMAGYEMSGGRDTTLIVQVARAIEMLHAHFLIIDDIQDRSVVRRGKPSAHVALAEYHRVHNLAGDADHFGMAIALNAAISGAAAAQMLLANVHTEMKLRLNAIGITNRTMKVTAHGQTGDIVNQVVEDTKPDDVDRVMEWKTASYTVLNPLHVGMVLAGADCHATDAITPFAIHIGKAFQITDDIIGVYGTERETGKSPMDDIREGKRTLLTVYALQNGTPAQKAYLKSALGNNHLTKKELNKCRGILEESGAKRHALRMAEKHTAKAISSLRKEEHRWSAEGVLFLKGLAAYISKRTA